MRPFLAKPRQPHHRIRRLGPNGQSVEFDQLPSEDQPLWTCWLLKHGDSFARRFAVRIRWQRLQSHALGSERWQTFAYFGPQRHHYSPLLLAKQVRQFVFIFFSDYKPSITMFVLKIT